ncbi:MAG: type II secretion system F family protein [Candidatus Omnitrophota bacterium]
MLYLVFLFIVAATVLIALGIKSPAQLSIDKTQLAKEMYSRPNVSKFSYFGAIFPFSRVILEKLKLYVKIKNRLDAARIRLNPEDFFNIKLLLIMGLVIAAPILLGKIDPPIMMIVIAVAYILPEVWLNKKINQRKMAVAKVLPETVDLLGLCVEAGLDFTSAVEWIVRKGITINTNPMIEELIFVVEEIKWGKPRSKSLKDMAKRLNIPEVNSFVQTLVQAERMGTPVSDAFSILSEDARMQRFNQGERFALKAPIKILVPLIFCILPVIGIVIGGPIFLQFSQGKMFGGF